jgi:hypothetical protein
VSGNRREMHFLSINADLFALRSAKKQKTERCVRAWIRLCGDCFVPGSALFVCLQFDLQFHGPHARKKKKSKDDDADTLGSAVYLYHFSS